MMDINEYKYKLELHAHTSPVSGCAQVSPRETVRLYADAGISGLAITNHVWSGLLLHGKDAVKFFLNDFYEARGEGVRAGVKVYLGAEIQFSENNNHFLVYGTDEDGIARAVEYIPLGLARYLREAKTAKNVAIQAHPYRDWNEPVPGVDGAEIFNTHPNHNARNALACRYAHEHNLISTAGSDFHHAGPEALGLLLAKTLPADTFELAELLRSRDYLLSVGGRIVVGLRG